MRKKVTNILLLVLIQAISVSVFAAVEPTVPVIDVDEKVSEPLDSGLGWQLMKSLPMGKSGKSIHMVLINHSQYTDKTIYSAAINRLCRSEKEFCRIRFWSNKRFLPEKASMTPLQYKELKAEYTFNSAAGILQTQWSCSVDPDKSHCVEH
ncbi:hypothetical protein SAMN05216419_1001161 [Nitrosomonas cryotolerans]|uniref:Uncharacterized protein n=1 Tax=Nitrosomonas cryotolerans ATCC 49181 TaxID=1131553 RepID=A0A1N6ILV3_9PROT|nr:hypothetical protein [Nitrosomonas cryotolerans]SFP37050.1 hypothetical protein SAMN05216419_1001161 [Nitrosomonas cryotolerans]SIO32933.1 hypothetical protein SAMN02743940_1905 [Nitrosomonas cryotolerans ATCC 49181]